MAKSLLVFFNLHLVFIAVASSEPFCVTPDYTCGPLIPIPPKSYDSQILMVNPEAKKIEYIHELFDRPNLRGRISVLSDGKEKRFIYDYKKQILIGISMVPDDVYKVKTLCTVAPLNDTDNSALNSLMGSTDPTGSSARIFNGAGALHYNPDMRFQYVPNKNLRIRQIPSEQWETCNFVPAFNTSFHIDYYWSKADTNNGHKVPLRATVNGSYIAGNYQRQMTHYYDFMTFKFNPTFTSSPFQIPRGVYCIGYDKRKPFPPLPDQFSFRLEFLFDNETPNTKEIGWDFEVWYDRKSSLIRFDYKPLAGEDLSIYGVSKISKVIDYKTDTVYVIDRILGNCTIRRLRSHDLPFPDQSSTADTAIPSPEDILQLNVTQYEYTGQQMVRDILCDVWIGITDTSTIEWYFLAESWSYDNGETIEKQIPVQLINRKSDSGMNLQNTYNFFQVRYYPEGFPFDIGSCFDASQQRHFQIGFSGTYYRVYKESPSVFLNISQITIAEILRINIIRVTDLQVDYNNKSNILYLEFTLLENSLNMTFGAEEMISVVDLLLESVDHNRFILKLPQYFPIKDRYIAAIPHSVLEMDSRGICEAVEVISYSQERLLRDDTPSENQDLADNFTSGAMAGLGVGMLVAGGIMGFLATVIVLYCLRRTTNHVDRQIIYRRNRDSESKPSTSYEQDDSPK